MKRLNRIIAAFMAISAVAASCQQENPEPNNPMAPGQVSVTVNAVMSDATKAVLSDAQPMVWENGDIVCAWYQKSDGTYSYADREDASAVVADQASTAKFTFANMPQGGKAWVAYGSNTGYDGCSARKVEFNYNSAQSQPVAGQMNKNYLKLVGDVIEVPVLSDGQTSAEISTQMNIVGTVLRFLVYSKTGAYKAENVVSVQLVSSDNAISGASAAIAYNFAEYGDTDAGYKYWGNAEGTSFTDECTIFWDATSQGITTTLSTPLSLDGVTEAVQGNGIYMAVPAVKIGGYKYVVTTDVAKYTFDASTTAVTFADNTVKNVLLDLENETAARLDLSSVKGDLQYIGDIVPNTVAASGCSETYIGYWYAQTRDTGADWVTRENEGNDAVFYTGVEFSVVDDATGAAADWLKVYYKENTTHWYIDAEPQAEGAAARSATVTATFADVDGYLVEEASKVKTIKVNQAAYTNNKVLGFFGGIGDQNVSGKEITNLSLGYCVITVDGVYAESWGDDKNNEQVLYGNVKITPYVFGTGVGAGATVADWLTVGYGKDADGKFNSTHLMLNASANTSGDERKALVYCEYVAPEGYEFEGGNKTFIRQFIVTQQAYSENKVIEFWGGLAAEYTHDEKAQNAWGLSWWVIKVDGTDATDWNGDSHNEQALYGAAEFKCYDYTNGVRGAEVDWLTVDYKYEGGKYIDTWWMVNISENTTGAQRRAEVVCTFPAMEGYEYKDGQNVRTVIITQSAGAGSSEPVVEGYSYNIVKNNGNPSGAIFGMPVGGANGADFRIENIKYDGVAVTLDEAKANEVMAMAFKTLNGRPEAGYDVYKDVANGEIYMKIVSFNGSTLEAGVATTAESQGYITRLTWYNYDGEEAGYWFVFVP